MISPQSLEELLGSGVRFVLNPAQHFGPHVLERVGSRPPCARRSGLGTLVHTEAGLTETSWTYLEADEIAESGLGRLNNHLRVRIRTWGESRTHEAIREIEWKFDRV